MKKWSALFLTLALLLTMTAGVLAEDNAIHILFWHTRGSGANYDVVTHEVETFNATIGAEKGIVVEEAYQGNYAQLWANVSTAAGDTAPDVVALGNTYVPYALDDDMIADMVPLAEADGYDLTGNVMDWVLQIAGNTDGEVHSLPYIRSTPVLYYNKDIADELGITINENITIDELVAFGRAAMQKDELGNTTRYGFELLKDFGYYNAAWIYQLGSQFLAAEGGSPALEDGTFLKVLTDWRSWVDEGWCRPFDASSQADGALQEFVGGRLAAYVNSCSAMAGIIKNAEANNINLGVAMFPTYNKDNHVAEIGGGNICIMSENKSDEQIKAAWEFVKFIMSDAEQYYNSINTGYCPCTLSVANDPEMSAFWDAHPFYRVPFNQLLVAGRGQELPALAQGQTFIQACEDTAGMLIQAQEITPEEAVQRLVDEESRIIW
ncbi:MAG: extracellular solute-binding protein [Clostridia bacterium]|nr:extracellular solute-binding protein [Clostridia bacterium]